MEYAYTFGDPSRLYLNVTNRCTNRCSFCIRYLADGVGGAHLRGGPEPGLRELLAAVDARGGPGAFSEMIWCGFGEPTLRLDLVREAGPIFRKAGARVRLNTNGHACLIHGRDVLPELASVLDEVSVSLNAPDLDRYLELCQPVAVVPQPVGSGGGDDDGAGGGAGADAVSLVPPERYWEAMLDFLTRAPAHIPWVQASVVRFTLAPEEIEACRALAASRGVYRFRVR